MLYHFTVDDRKEAKGRLAGLEKDGQILWNRNAKWTPSKRAIICSKHFTADDFTKRFVNVGGEGTLGSRWLKRDELGKTVFPTIHVIVKEQQPTERDKRMVRLITDTCC